MGTWGTGAFDNDIAADWSGNLDDANPGKRPGLVRRAFNAVLATNGYLDCVLACEAIAAVAVLATQRPGGPAMTSSSYAPDFLIAGGTVDLPTDVDLIAVQVIDRILGEGSEWMQLWQESSKGGEAIAEIQALREVLTRSSSGA